MMTAFVTGATGFLGTWLCKELVKRGQVVTLFRDAVMRTPFWCEELCRNVVKVRGDISSIAFLERVLSEYEVSTVYALAAQTQVSTSVADPAGTLETNVRGTWNLLEACRRQKTPRIIIASSDKAYANGPIPYKEDQPLSWTDPYSTSKACADMLAQSFAATYGMSIGIARCGNLYGGGHLNWSTLVPSTIRSVLEGKRPVLRSDGKMRRDWLYVEDAVRAYITLAESKHVGPFNFGGGQPTSVIDMVSLILEVMDSKLEPEFRIEPGVWHEIKDQWLDCSRALSVLGWAPAWPKFEGLKKTVEWYKGAKGRYW